MCPSNNLKNFLVKYPKFRQNKNIKLENFFLFRAQMENMDLMMEIQEDRLNSMLKVLTKKKLKEKKEKKIFRNVCPRTLDSFYTVTYYIKWIKTYWTYSRTAQILTTLKSTHG